MTGGPASRTAARVAWVLTLGLVAAGIAFRSMAVDPPFEIAFFVVQALAFATVGLLIAVRRPENAVGWLFLAVGTVVAVYVVAVTYQHHALVVSPGTLPFGSAAAWLQAWVYVPALGTFVTVLPQLFPTGRPVSRRWRPALWLAGVALVAFVLIDALRPGPISQSSIVNPLGIEPSLHATLELVGLPLYLLATLVGVASLVVRWRGADTTERQQLKWFGYAAALLPVVVIAFLLVDVVGVGEHVGTFPLEAALTVPAYLGLPIATTIAILRHRLFDIDRIISRTITYTVLIAALAGVYGVVVVSLQTLLEPVAGESDVAVAGSTLAVAALVGPVGRRIRRRVDRRFNRASYDAARAVESFGQRLRDEVDLDEVATELRTSTARTFEPETVSVWLVPGKVTS